jgi:hypothetical protein
MSVCSTYLKCASRPTDRRRAVGLPQPGSGGGFDRLPDGFLDELAR